MNQVFPALPEVLIAAHGNSLRALVKILDNVPEDAEPGNMAGARHAWLKILDYLG